jgi:hypothetical protein
MWLQASDDVKFGRPLTHQRQEAIRRLRRARAGRSYGVSQATISTLAVPNLSRQARPAREKEMSEARLIQERLRTPQQNQWFYTGRIPGDSAVFTLPLARGSIFAPRSLQAPMASSTSAAGKRRLPKPDRRRDRLLDGCLKERCTEARHGGAPDQRRANGQVPLLCPPSLRCSRQTVEHGADRTAKVWADLSKVDQ